MSAGRLVVCPTPIGNLQDITLRVLETLRLADVIACEDTRHTRTLLQRHDISGAKLASYHEHNERERAREIVKRVAGGEVVAVVSDAGTPGISDPGSVVVRLCLEHDLHVEVLPGACAVTTAVVASGLELHEWTFIGFLPRRLGELRDVFSIPGALVAYESPRRLVKSLQVLAELESERQVAVCRELTKIHEEVVRVSAHNVVAHFDAEPPRGEIVIVIGSTAHEEEFSTELAIAQLRALVASGAKPRVAAKAIAELTGLRANDLYRAL